MMFERKIMLIAILSILLGTVLGIGLTALGVLGALRFIHGRDDLPIAQGEDANLA
jgi:hypothetical protein